MRGGGGRVESCWGPSRRKPKDIERVARSSLPTEFERSLDGLGLPRVVGRAVRGRKRKEGLLNGGRAPARGVVGGGMGLRTRQKGHHVITSSRPSFSAQGIEKGGVGEFVE
ncbi:hypothetical protein CDAR_483131 [Caerostris darwini]|uniref:Uncharacterized protein n=1 Tax=Caerostris darwini TaxID=1538125 RepID=A0AAV4V5W7_9ARAC|nr:hypothetical protein CDAR_483131 [Caerostris darwini]